MAGPTTTPAAPPWSRFPSGLSSSPAQALAASTCVWDRDIDAWSARTLLRRQVERGQHRGCDECGFVSLMSPRSSSADHIGSAPIRHAGRRFRSHIVTICTPPFPAPCYADAGQVVHGSLPVKCPMYAGSFRGAPPRARLPSGPPGPGRATCHFRVCWSGNRMLDDLPRPPRRSRVLHRLRPSASSGSSGAVPARPPGTSRPARPYKPGVQCRAARAPPSVLGPRSQRHLGPDRLWRSAQGPDEPVVRTPRLA